MFKMTNGFTKAMYWTYDKMLAHAEKYSKGFAAKKGFTFWEKDFDSMACKTLIRQLISKWGIMSVEMQRGYKADMAVVSDINDSKSDFTVEYVDNPETTVVDATTGEVLDAKITQTQIDIINACDVADVVSILKHYDVEKVEDLSAKDASEICTYLATKAKME